MALFQKKPYVTSSAPAYTIGSTKTVLIVGLGNPGKEHRADRHNIGFAILESFARANDFPAWLRKKDLTAEITIKNLSDSRVVLCKPQTFMNHSGQAAAAVQRFYRITNQDTLAVYDELALPFGQLRARVGGSDAGHNGVKSLIAHLGTDFGRLRIGIASPDVKQDSAADFVLQPFSKAERQRLPQLEVEAAAMITEYVFGGQLPHDTRSIN
jgi:PTH1 family peptidyl-tRNA hydrolase